MRQPAIGARPRAPLTARLAPLAGAVLLIGLISSGCSRSGASSDTAPNQATPASGSADAQVPAVFDSASADRIVDALSSSDSATIRTGVASELAGSVAGPLLPPGAKLEIRKDTYHAIGTTLAQVDASVDSQLWRLLIAFDGQTWRLLDTKELGK